MVKKLFALAFCAAALVGLLTTTASAGEVTGNGKGGYQGTGQPAATLKGHASECAFSGQNDDPSTGVNVQNYGHRFDDPFFIEFTDNSRGASEVTVITPFGELTLGCNKHAGAESA